MTDDADDFDDDGCPVPCARCGRIVDLHDCRHAPGCTRCWGKGSCDNLICPVCFREEERAT